MREVTLTTEQLVRRLCERLEGLLTDFPLLRPDGAEVRGPAVHAHSAPLPSSTDAETDRDVAPYLVVRATGGSFPDSVTVEIAALLWDDREENRGDADILNIIQMIVTDLRRKPMLGPYRAQTPIQWKTGDTDVWPYFWGALIVTFAVPDVTTEDEFA